MSFRGNIVLVELRGILHHFLKLALWHLVLPLLDRRFNHLCQTVPIHLWKLGAVVFGSHMQRILEEGIEVLIQALSNRKDVS